VKKTAKGLRLVGYLEGLSYIALLGIAMPLKYVWDFPEAVRYLGALHGALFIIYVAAAIRTARAARWPAMDLIEALAVSVFPARPVPARARHRHRRGSGRARTIIPHLPGPPMNHPLLLEAHNLTRWAVLATAAWALVHAWRGWLARAPWRLADRLPGLIFTTVLNLQFVVGVILYYNSPIVRPVFSSLAYAGSTPPATFFTLLHPAAMIAAALLAQVAYSIAKRASDDRRRFRAAAVGYSIATILVVIAIPWPHLPYGRPLLPASG
jgi:integral membrane protein